MYMEELIKYFEKIETRLSALEAAEANEAPLEARIAALEAQVVAQRAQLMEMQSHVSALQEQIATATIVAAAAAEATTAVAAQEDAIDESDDVKTDEETGLPELEVEFIDEEEAEVPALDIPMLEILADEAEEEAPEVQVVVPAEAKQEETKQPAAVEVATTAAPVTAEPISSVVPKLEDIRKGITMGDRFLFQRELFGNNGELMNKTIDKLNKMGSYDEAMTFVQNQFAGWDKESNAYELFITLLKRRW